MEIDMNIQNDKDFAALPEIAKLYQVCKERDLTISEREYLKGARDAWQAAKAQAVPEGFVLVPKEPTREMLLRIESPSGFNFEVPCGYENAGIDADTASEIYKAMIKAAQESAND